MISRRIEQLLRSIYDLRRRTASEAAFLKRSLERFSRSGQVLLDVGCGYCRFYPTVTACGLSYIGIDKNVDICKENTSRGIRCLPSDVAGTGIDGIDVLLLSHIIEHFDYHNLIPFLNLYLPKLRVGGVLIILTPIQHRGFYDDFDHVKPYNPAALRQAFVDQRAQTQNFGICGTYSEEDLWLKRDTPWHSFHAERWMHFIKIPLSLLSTITLGRIGRLTGYGMVLRKLDE